MAFRLPRLPLNVPFVNPKTGTPTTQGQGWWQSVVKKIETQEATQDQMLTDIQTALTNAGIALDHANSVMLDIPPVTVIADYAGTILAGQLPRNIQATRFDDTTDVTTSATWSAETVSGDAAYTIGAATGILNVTALTVTTVIKVTSVYNSITRSRLVQIVKSLQDPPPASATATAYDSSVDATNAATYGSANAGTLTLTCGASGEVALTAPLEMTTASIAAQAAYGKWQVSPAGAGTWTDVDTEIASSTSAQAGSGGSVDQSGWIEVSQTASGLTPSSDYDFQLLLRNASGTATIYYFGTATATTS